MLNSRRETTAPKIWKKLAATITMNQKSKNLSLSRKPSSSQFFYQWVWPLKREVVISSSDSLWPTAFRLK